VARFEVLKDHALIERFKNAFCSRISYDIPSTYFKKGECYALLEDEKTITSEGTMNRIRIVGGFCLIHDLPWKLRSIKQIPEDAFLQATRDLPTLKTAEFTGYFLNDKKYGLLFTSHLVKTCLLHKASRFVYSYPTRQTGLEKYYSKGKPRRLYSGLPAKLPGHKDKMEDENVEVLTRWGIIKIFMARTIREILKK